MNAVQRQRLQQLIAFLRTLKPEQFCFSMLRREGKCGTVGCAMGWTPDVFRELVSFKKTVGGPAGWDFTWKPTGVVCGYDSLSELLFGIPADKGARLFTPECQSFVSDKLPNLPPYAHVDEVAAMLERFLELVEAGELAHRGLTPVSDALPVESGVVA